MDTYHYLENISEGEGLVDDGAEIPESVNSEPGGAPALPAKAPLMAAKEGLPAHAFASGIPDLNKINMNIQGDRVLLSGLLDLKGLRLLKKRIESLETLLEPFEDDRPVAAFDETNEESRS
ncbi:hypothetical protein A9995_06705 [Erythrobacter sp. QSSC1-22B]|nr:hypothetical protein A9995_06705 [Erythrobacter sp. QSSC1-22B]